MQILLVFVLYFLWSSSFSLGKIALSHSPPVFLTSFRMLFAGIILVGFLLLKKRSKIKLSKKHFLSLGILGFFSIYLTNICEFWGLSQLSAAKTCFIYSLSPFFSVLFSYIHFKEKINFKKCIGLFIGFLGFLPVLFFLNGSENISSIFNLVSLADLSIICAALFSVYGWVLLRILVKDQEISPFIANGISMVLGGTMALVHSFFVDTWNPLPIDQGYFYPFFLSVVAITIISNLICYNLYGFLLKRFTATFLSFAGLLSPVFASINSWILIKETPSPVIFLSTAVVCVGLWIVYQTELKQGYIVRSKASASTTK